MNEKARNNLISLVAATALYAVQSFLLSAQKRNIFNIPADNNAVYFLAACFSFLFGAAFWFVCIRAVFCIKDKETSKVKEFAICFIPLFIILMLVFPGIFKGDEFYVLNAVKDYGLSPAQGGITSFFYIASLNFFPSLFTIPFMQIFIISLIYSYVFSGLKKIPFLSDKKYAILILRLVLFLLPIIDASLFTLRASLAGWCFLAAVMGTLSYYYDEDGNVLCNIIKIAVFTALAIALRSELFYLIILLPEFFILFAKKRERKKKYKSALILLGLCVSFFLVFNIPNKIANGKSNKYPISLVLNPVSNILHQEEIRGEHAYDDIMAINELVDVKAYVTHASVRNISQFWDIPDELPPEQLNSFMSASYDLILNNLDSFFKYRWLTFAHTNGMYKDEINHPTAPEAETIYTLSYYGRDYGADYYFSKPFAPLLRSKVIDLLLARHYDNENTRTFWYYPVFYNCIPLIILGFILFIISLFKKDGLYSYMIFTVAVQLFLLFLTAPAMFFMYYFAFYLTGWFISLIYIFRLTSERQNEKHSIGSKKGQDGYIG